MKFQKLNNETINDTKRRLYKEWKSKGLCVVCGNHPKTKTTLRCQNCKPTKEQNRRRKLREDYGITLEQYNSLYILQDGKCEICKESLLDAVIDHDHSTNKLRGIICRKCNTALGMIGDNQIRIQNMIIYLQKYSQC